VATEVKFCGLTRRVDAQLAARLGARYLGVIFAGGPRLQTVASARDVFTGSDATARRVGVFGTQSVAEITSIADDLELDVVQLHGDPEPDRVAALRRSSRRQVWSVIRTAAAALPAHAAELFAASDAVVLDAKVEGKLGGTGVPLDWSALADSVDAARGTGRLVVAGGLDPSNVGRAIALLHPDVVDVSSGIESSPGIKSPAAMRNFLLAVAQAQVMA
jgi:phosphoribosylanthranilate isomerase